MHEVLNDVDVYFATSIIIMLSVGLLFAITGLITSIIFSFILHGDVDVVFLALLS